MLFIDINYAHLISTPIYGENWWEKVVMVITIIFDRIMKLNRMKAISSSLFPIQPFEELVSSYATIIITIYFFKIFTAWKVSQQVVISGLYFPVFGLNMGKYGPEVTPYLDTFHAMFFYLDLQINRLPTPSKHIKIYDLIIYLNI